MTVNEIIPLLKTFSKKEMYLLHIFLKSPYHNKNVCILKLYSELRKCYPKFTSRKIEIERLYKTIYGDLEYKYSTMRNLYFRLGELIEKFLKFENMLNNELYTGTLLLHEYNSRIQRRLFDRQLDEMESVMKKRGEMDNDYFHAKFLIEAEKFNSRHFYVFKTVRDEIKYKVRCSDNSAAYLTINYIREMLSFYLSQNTLLNRFNLEEENTLISEITGKLDFKSFDKLLKKNDHYFLLNLYYKLWICFNKFDERKYYYDYKETLNKVFNKLGADEKSFHYSNLISYCIYKQRQTQHEKSFGKELLGVYKIFLEKELFKNKKIDFIQHNLYRSILMLAIDMNDLPFAKTLIEKYSRKVEYQLREKMYSYGNAFYYYYTGNYQKSLEFLPDILTDNFQFRYDSRHLQIANNFGLGNLENIDNMIHEYRVAVNENEIMPVFQKQRHYNYLNTVKKLLDYLYGKDRNDPEYIKTQLVKMEKVVKRPWLMELCDNIISNRIPRIFPQKTKVSRTG